MKPSRYSWRTSEWKECQVSLLLEQQDPHWHVTGPVCGGGIQTCEVYCAQSSQASSAQRAKEGRQFVPETDGAVDWKGNRLQYHFLIFFWIQWPLSIHRFNMCAVDYLQTVPKFCYLQ